RGELLQLHILDAVDQRRRVPGVLVDPAGPAAVRLPAHLVAGVVGAAGNGDVDRDRARAVDDQEAHPVGDRVDGRGEGHGGEEALEAELVVAGRGEELGERHLHLVLTRRDDVGARVAGVAEAVAVGVGLRGIGGAVAVVEGIAHAVPVGVGLTGVGGAAGAGAGAALGDVTGAGGRPADGGGRGEGIRGAGVVDAVAALGDITDAGSRAADRRALGVGRTGLGAAVAGVGHVAGTRRRPADDEGAGHAVGRTVVADPVAALG